MNADKRDDIASLLDADERAALRSALTELTLAERDGNWLCREGRLVAFAPEWGPRVAIPGRFVEQGPMHPLLHGERVLLNRQGRRQFFIELDATWGELKLVLESTTDDPDPDVLVELIARLRERIVGSAS